MSLPSTRQAFIQTARGSPDKVIHFDTFNPLPILEANDVLVKVSHVSLNPVGYKLMLLMPSFVHKLPGLLENDFAGVVVDNNGNEKWKVGQAVIGSVSISDFSKKGRGALATYIAANTRDLASLPSSIPPSLGAALPIVALTSYLALTRSPTSPIKPDDRVFINGGSSSVGMLAIQLAKSRGAWVGTSCSEGSFGLVKGLGADEVFDYRASPLHKQLSSPTIPPYSIFFDTIGLPILFTHCESYLTPTGTFIGIAADDGGNHSLLGNMKAFAGRGWATSRPGWLGGVRRRFVGLIADWDEEAMRVMMEMVAEGKMTLPIDSTFPFTEQGVQDAYKKMMSGRAKGKIIVELP